MEKHWWPWNKCLKVGRLEIVYLPRRKHMLERGTQYSLEYPVERHLAVFPLEFRWWCKIPKPRGKS